MKKQFMIAALLSCATVFAVGPNLNSIAQEVSVAVGEGVEEQELVTIAAYLAEEMEIDLEIVQEELANAMEREYCVN